jgi:Putative Actinobacterial Holin-X, holin superfamily III
MLMLVQVLAAYTEIPLWGCYGIVGGVLVVLGGVLFAVGKRTAEAIDVVPQRTLETMKENAQWFTEQTTCNRTSTTPVTRSRTAVRP